MLVEAISKMSREEHKLAFLVASIVEQENLVMLWDVMQNTRLTRHIGCRVVFPKYYSLRSKLLVAEMDVSRSRYIHFRDK